MNKRRSTRISVEDAIIVFARIEQRERAGKRLVVLEIGPERASRPRVENATLKALSRVVRCRRMLDIGVHATLELLARAKSVAPS
jgi:hypothetical protein